MKKVKKKTKYRDRYGQIWYGVDIDVQGYGKVYAVWCKKYGYGKWDNGKGLEIIS